MNLYGFAEITTVADEGSVYIQRTKFRKDRLIPLPKAVLAQIENYLATRRVLCPDEIKIRICWPVEDWGQLKTIISATTSIGRSKILHSASPNKSSATSLSESRCLIACVMPSP